jgi:hypothetical protein
MNPFARVINRGEAVGNVVPSLDLNRRRALNSLSSSSSQGGHQERRTLDTRAIQDPAGAEEGRNDEKAGQAASRFQGGSAVACRARNRRHERISHSGRSNLNKKRELGRGKLIGRPTGNPYLVRNRILVIFDKKARTRRSSVQEIKLAAALIEREKEREEEMERRDNGRWMAVRVCTAVIKLRYIRLTYYNVE